MPGLPDAPPSPIPPYANNPKKNAAWENNMASLRKERARVLADYSYPGGLRAALDAPGFAMLRDHEVFEFSVEEYPFAEVFAQVTGLRVPLDRLHEAIPEFSRGSSHFEWKKALLAPFRDAAARAPFEELIDRFVVGAIAPNVAAKLDCDRVVYQCFPCLRIQQPCDFHTIRAHCDSMYCHQEGSLNYYVPLTATFGSAAIQIESAPGKEDFRPLTLRYGQAARIYATECAHYTMPNVTDHTRVTFDLRVVPGAVFDESSEIGRLKDGEQQYEVGEYYAEIRRDGGPGGAWVKTRSGRPSLRHGFPFDNE